MAKACRFIRNEEVDASSDHDGYGDPDQKIDQIPADGLQWAALETEIQRLGEHPGLAGFLDDGCAGTDEAAFACGARPQRVARRHRSANLQQPFDRVRKLLQMAFDRRRDCIEPVHRGHEVRERLGRVDVLDPHRNERDAGRDGAFDLAADLPGIVCAGREDQQHHAALVDRLDDGRAPLIARRDVAGRDPASDAVALEHRTGSIGRRLVDMRVADEDVVSHSRSPRCGGRRLLDDTTRKTLARRQIVRNSVKGLGHCRARRKKVSRLWPRCMNTALCTGIGITCMPPRWSW